MLLRGGIFACMLTNVFSITTKVCGPNYPTYMYFVPRVVITQKRKMSTFQKSQTLTTCNDFKFHIKRWNLEIDHRYGVIF